VASVRRKLGGGLALLATLAVAGTALAHDFDHAPPTFSEPAPLSTGVNAGGDEAEWELVATIPTGNPQTDLDFFTVKGITYASVGSLAAGPNSAGQNIVQLTNEKGEVEPSYVTGHPSATCPKATSSATGLQHDAEASPKGKALLQYPNPYVVTSDTQVVVDATDATGRCHDQGNLGVQAAPQGGLEIIDVTDPTAPKEIGLTSHVGQAHTVNVDPKRPHIAFVSSSDQVNYDEEGVRANDEHPAPPPDGTAAPGAVTNSMDGIEVVDMSSCMNFPPGATLEFKRNACQPVVYRYRWPNVDFARSSTFPSTGACHELEIYPDDRVVCAALMSTLILDFSDAFDDNGTPTDYTDDKLRGTPLPCARRETSTSADPWRTGAFVQDCVIGAEGKSLRVPEWRKLNPPPSLEGVTKIGGAHHMGFHDQRTENFNPPYESTKDIFVAHEAELTQSGRYVLVTDERGGGILPVGASCSPGADNPLGNGGIHAFPVDKLGATPPAPTDAASPEVDAYQKQIYATDSKGDRAIYRAPVHTEPQGSVCTSHVFQQIPGQNRIFMGWYSQGTQVVDFTENANGTIDFKTAGYFIPENANTWTSHIFKVQENKDGTFTYWGATGDFALGDAGRNAIDIYKVTLPPAPKPRTASGEPPPGTPTIPVSDTRGVPVGTEPPACAAASGFETTGAKPRAKRRRVRFSFVRRTENGVRVRVFRHSRGRGIARRKVADFRNRKGAFTWKARRLRNGFYVARFTTKAPNGSTDFRHVALRRKRGRFYRVPYFDRRASCELVKYATLGRPVFGGKKRRPLKLTFRLRKAATVEVVVRRGGKVVKRYKAKTYRPGKQTLRVKLGRRAKRGTYRVGVKATRPGQVGGLVLYSRYL
jgi:hypothetical protein